MMLLTSQYLLSVANLGSSEVQLPIGSSLTQAKRQTYINLSMLNWSWVVKTCIRWWYIFQVAPLAMSRGINEYQLYALSLAHTYRLSCFQSAVAHWSKLRKGFSCRVDALWPNYLVLTCNRPCMKGQIIQLLISKSISHSACRFVKLDQGPVQLSVKIWSKRVM